MIFFLISVWSMKCEEIYYTKIVASFLIGPFRYKSDGASGIF